MTCSLPLFSPGLISIGNHPLFSSQPLCPVRLLPPLPPRQPPLGSGHPADSHFKDERGGEERSRPSHQTSSQKGGRQSKEREREHTRTSTNTPPHTHTHTHRALRRNVEKCVTQIYIALYSGSKFPVLSTKHSRRRGGKKNTTLNKSYGN